MKNQHALRLALRMVGDLWNAYVAPLNTMEGAVYLGGIAMSAAARNPDVKSGFMALMQTAMADALAELGAGVGHWNEPVKAPPHEKAGRA